MRSERSSSVYFWGSTAEERQAPFPCDRHVPEGGEALFRAVDVEAPPQILFRWLCQLKTAPYSYDWIDNFGRQSPRRLIPGIERLEVGQHAMTYFEIVDFSENQHLTLRLTNPGTAIWFGQLAVSYVIKPRGEEGSRLLVKLLVRYPRAPLGWAMRAILPWGDLIMMRKQLLTLKGLAEARAPH